jgi:hypothetical protein
MMIEKMTVQDLRLLEESQDLPVSWLKGRQFQVGHIAAGE